MALFRPSNLNKRLVSSTGGNGGVIGTTKTPYCTNGVCATLCLGSRCAGIGGCGGIFRITESFCGVKENCQIPFCDYGGFFICCGPSTAKWFVAPSCTGVIRSYHSRADAVTVANSCMGSCGWFVPSCGQLQNPGYCCRTYWDSYSCGFLEYLWSDTDGGVGHRAWRFRMCDGFAYNGIRDGTYRVRAFRCTAT